MEAFMDLKEAEDSKWLHYILLLCPCRLHVAHLSAGVLTKFLQWLVCISCTAYSLCVESVTFSSQIPPKGQDFFFPERNSHGCAGSNMLGTRSVLQQRERQSEHPESWWVCVWDCHCNSASTSSRQRVCIRTGGRSSNTKVIQGEAFTPQCFPCSASIFSAAFPRS